MTEEKEYIMNKLMGLNKEGREYFLTHYRMSKSLFCAGAYVIVQHQSKNKEIGEIIADYYLPNGMPGDDSHFRQTLDKRMERLGFTFSASGSWIKGK